MTPAEKAAVISGLTGAAFELARAGIRHRYPHASPREQFLRLAIVSLGPELARQAYPEIASLESDAAIALGPGRRDDGYQSEYCVPSMAVRSEPLLTL
jgi:hypothetical protein